MSETSAITANSVWSSCTLADVKMWFRILKYCKLRSLCTQQPQQRRSELSTLSTSQEAEFITQCVHDFFSKSLINLNKLKWKICSRIHEGTAQTLELNECRQILINFWREQLFR